MKKINYAMLCGMVAGGNQPEAIVVDGIEFVWNGDDYVDDAGKDLHKFFFLTELVENDIECVNNILTEKEKGYLTLVLLPFRDKVTDVVKLDTRNEKEFIVAYLGRDDELTFPAFPAGEHYKGMELNKHYTLEELGL